MEPRTLTGVSPNDSKVHFDPPRPSYFPDVYIMKHHPKNKGRGSSYYYIQDGTLEGMAKVYELEHCRLRVPGGGEKGAINAGFLKLEPGDFIFARLKTSPCTGELDVPVVWVNPINIFPDTLRNETLEIRNRILGPSQLRSRKKPDDTGKGGTAFERETKPTGVRGGRCYAYGMSHERPNWLAAPCADGKISKNSDATTELRQGLLRVSMDMAVKALKNGPAEIVENLTINHELLNIPSIGVDTNKFFTAAQLNLASAECSSSSKGLGWSLGGAGIEHFDDGDHPAYFTHMVGVSDIPKNFHPGLFFILYPGVYIELSDFASIVFSGLRKHGGTPPIAPPHTLRKVLDSAVRVTLIAYPPVGLTTASQSRLIGAVAENKVIYATEEVIHPNPKPVEFSQHATFSQDGGVIMDNKSLMNFIARSLLGISNNLLSQVDRSLNAKINSDLFLHAFSFDNKDGSSTNVDPWPLGPGYRPSDSQMDIDPPSPNPHSPLVSQQKILDKACQSWKHYLSHYAAHIPYAVHRRMVAPLEGTSSENPLSVSPLDGIAGRPDTTDPFKPRKKKPLVATNGHSKAKRKRGKTTKSLGNYVAQSSGHENSDDDSEMESHKAKRLRLRQDDEESAVTRSSQRLKNLSQDIPKVAKPSHNRHNRDIHGIWNDKAYGDFTETYDPSLLLNMKGYWSEIEEELEIMDELVEIADISGISDEALSGINNLSSFKRPSDVQNLPYYLQCFTANLIQCENNAVHESIIDIISYGLGGHWSNESSSALSTFQQAMTSNPLSKTSLSTLTAGLVSVKKLQTNEQVASLLLRKQRACIVLMSFIAWRWFNSTIPLAINEIRQGTNQISWLQLLISAVENGMKNGGTITFISSQFLDDNSNASCIMDFTQIRQTGDEDVDNQASTNAVTTILEVWTDYKPTKQTFYQAYLTFLLLRDIGPDIFLLDATWNLYQKISATTFKGTGPIDFDSKPADPSSHPLFNPDSSQRQTLHSIATAIQDFLDEEKWNTISQASTQTSIISDIAPTSTKSFLNRHQEAFAQFLKDSYLIALGYDTSNIVNQKLVEEITKNPDHYQPFREKAPTRIKMRQGPFSPKYARTIAGAFSGAIVRGISFGTPFSRDPKTPSVFHSAMDFKRVQKKTKDKDPSYFCNPRAYGTYNSYRNVDLAPQYWKAVNKYPWPALETDEPIPFLTMYRYFRPATGHARFPQLGPLASYLLTADYVYCGIVTPPTSADMAYMVHQLNAGAMAGLELLGLIPRRNRLHSKNISTANQDQCLKGFERATELVKDAIPQDLHADLCVDLILVEHALCKFKRALIEGLIQV